MSARKETTEEIFRPGWGYAQPYYRVEANTGYQGMGDVISRNFAVEASAIYYAEMLDNERPELTDIRVLRITPSVEW